MEDKLSDFRHPEASFQKAHLKHLLLYAVKKWVLSNLSNLSMYQLLMLHTDSTMRPLSPSRQKSQLNYNRCLISWWLISGEMKLTPRKQNGAVLKSMYLMPPASISLKCTKYCSQREIKLIYSGSLNSNDTLIMKNKWFPSVKFIPWPALW